MSEPQPNPNPEGTSSSPLIVEPMGELHADVRDILKGLPCRESAYVELSALSENYTKGLQAPH